VQTAHGAKVWNISKLVKDLDQVNLKSRFGIFQNRILKFDSKMKLRNMEIRQKEFEFQRDLNSKETNLTSFRTSELNLAQKKELCMQCNPNKF
jgi:hypothetical protein